MLCEQPGAVQIESAALLQTSISEKRRGENTTIERVSASWHVATNYLSSDFEKMKQRNWPQQNWRLKKSSLNIQCFDMASKTFLLRS